MTRQAHPPPSYDDRQRASRWRFWTYFLLYRLVAVPLATLFILAMYFVYFIWRLDTPTDYTQFPELGALTQLKTRMTGSIWESWENNPEYIAAGRPSEPLEYLPFTNYGERLRIDLWLTELDAETFEGKIRFYQSSPDGPGLPRADAPWQRFEGTHVGWVYSIEVKVPLPLGGDEPLQLSGSTRDKRLGRVDYRLSGQWYRDQRPQGYFSIEPVIGPDPESPHADDRNRAHPKTPFDGLVAGKDY